MDDIKGPQKVRIRRLLERICSAQDIAGEPDEVLRDLHRKLVAYTWKDQELGLLERQVLLRIEALEKAGGYGPDLRKAMDRTFAEELARVDGLERHDVERLRAS